MATALVVHERGPVTVTIREPWFVYRDEEPPVPGPSLAGWALALLVLGLVWRTVRYLLPFPMWGDEAFVCLGLLDQTYRGLMQQQCCGQVAPLLFLWGELTAYHLLGASEWALRLLPFLAGMGALALFWKLARLTLSPLAGTLAVGLLAVSIWPVSMCTFVKPYSFDLLLALALLLPAVQWLRQPAQLRWLATLAILVPVALLGSYPAVFVAGGVSVALLPVVWRQPGWPTRLLYLVFNLLMLAGFLASYLLVGVQQLDPVNGSVERYLLAYWADAFPPAAPLAFLRWLLLIHTGRLMAYPVGDANGASIVTLLLVLVGVRHCWRSGRRPLVMLCGMPFVLNFVAAVLRRYPYGGCCRISQHLAPAICVLAGTGLAAVIEHAARTPTARRRWLLAVFGGLALVGVGGLARDLVKPYRSQGDLWTRRLVQEVLAHAGPSDQVVVLNSPREVKALFCWLLMQHGPRVAWDGHIDWERLEAMGQLWCLRFAAPVERERASSRTATRTTATLAAGSPPVPAELSRRLVQSKRSWVLADYVPYTLVPTDSNGPRERCELFRWVAPVAGAPPMPVEDLSCWP
jgi:4-amino-4-deoxy-L-arabinose transferase-like glycosyltransferase